MSDFVLIGVMFQVTLVLSKDVWRLQGVHRQPARGYPGQGHREAVQGVRQDIQHCSQGRTKQGSITGSADKKIGKQRICSATYYTNIAQRSDKGSAGRSNIVFTFVVSVYLVLYPLGSAGGLKFFFYFILYFINI